jgi:hypothetical protein
MHLRSRPCHLIRRPDELSPCAEPSEEAATVKGALPLMIPAPRRAIARTSSVVHIRVAGKSPEDRMLHPPNKVMPAVFNKHISSARCALRRTKIEALSCARGLVFIRGRSAAKNTQRSHFLSVGS